MEVSTIEFEVALVDLLNSPADQGLLELIVVRPTTNARATPESVYLSPELGITGDRWQKGRTLDPANQVSLMNARVLRLIAGEESRMALAGDNLIVDLDLSEGNIPVGQKLAIGEVVLEVTDLPHTGCSKFQARYGKACRQFINAPNHAKLHLRGLYARVLQAGQIQVGDRVHKFTR
jgi:MOSC domain-containing protein YiiM